MNNNVRGLSLTTLLAAALVLSTLALSASGDDNAHFYKSPSMYGSSPACWFDHTSKHGTRAASSHDWLTKLDFAYSMGNTRNSYNSGSKTSNILNPAGPTNLVLLGENVVKTSPALQTWSTFILANPQLLAGNNESTFAQWQFSGKFTMQEYDMSWRQNIVKGIFFDVSLPVRVLKINNIGYQDLTPETGNGGFNKTTPSYVQLTNNINTILASYGLNPLTSTWSKTGIGDLSANIGWEKMFNGLNDHAVALTVKAGVLAPTAPVRDTSYVFSLPLGYNHHFGINLFGQLEATIVKHISVRAHLGGTFFLKDNVNMRVKTAAGQNGYLLLASGKASEEPGTLWHAGADLSADHFLGGLSARVGYSFTQQEAPTVSFPNINSAVASSNIPFADWNVHTLNVVADYDMSVHFHDASWAPRIGGFYNLPFAGKNAFKMQTFGGSAGLDIRWKI